VSSAVSERDRSDAWWIAAFAGVAAAFSGTEPTGFAPADVVLTGLFGLAVAMAAARARRWTWVWMSGVAFAASGGEAYWILMAGTAFAISIGAAAVERRGHMLGALVGGLAVLPLLHLPDDYFHGASALIAAAAVLPVLVSGYVRSRRNERRRARQAVLGLGALALLACVAYGAAAVLARQDLQSGVDDAEQALELIRDGRTDEASEVLASAGDSFDRAEALLAGPLGAPARAVPIVGHHARATAEMTRAGADLAAVAERTSTSARYDTVTFTAGHIDLGELGRLERPVAESRDALIVADERLAELDESWLVPTVAEPLAELQTEVRDALDEATIAQDAIAVAPGLLGVNGPARYLVLLGQPAESRFGGGFVGTWAELEALSGQVDLAESGTIEELRNAEGFRNRKLEDLPEFLDRYGRYFPAYNLQNATATPDFPTTRQVMQQMYPVAGGRPIEGTIYLDPAGVAALLELSGPVEVEGLPTPLDSANAEALLVSEIYELYPEEAERDEVLQNAIDALFDALTSRDLPGPRTIADALSPAVRGNHLAVSVSNPAAEGVFEQVGATGAFPQFDDGADLLAVKTANAAPNKIDTYIDRQIDYQVEYDPDTGATRAVLTLGLTNNAPSSGLPPSVGTNRGIVDGSPNAPPPGTAMFNVSVWSPLDLGGVLLDGHEVGAEQQAEFGRYVYSTQVTVYPGESAELVLELTGVLDRPYELFVDHQALVNDDEVHVRVRTPDGWRAADVRGFEETDDGLVYDEDALTEDTRLSADFVSS
jgi:hypothetical protein